MKPPINILTTFARVKDEDGTDNFVGTIDVATLKRTKVKEIEVVLLPMERVPKTVAKLMARNSANKDGLIMFAAFEASDGATKKGGPEK